MIDYDLSICINTRNRSNYLIETIETILPYHNNSTEVVIVDGGSTDNTSDICKDYSARYPFIKYYQQTDKIGIDEGYDLSVKFSSGKYCWLLPDDDVLTDDALDILFKKYLCLL